MYFPIYVVDDFFKNPEKIAAWGNTLEFAPCRIRGGKWPGVRTEDLHTISAEAKTFHYKLTNKLLSIITSPAQHMEMRVSLFFQRIDYDIYGRANEGWIHTDGPESMIGGIIYLSKNIKGDCGTTIYHKPNPLITSWKPDWWKMKDECFSAKGSLEFNEDNIDKYKKANKEHRRPFQETIKVHNKYNRLIMFDSNNYHGVPEIYSDKDTDPRLTIVFFVHTVRSDWFPIPHSRIGDL